MVLFASNVPVALSTLDECWGAWSASNPTQSKKVHSEKAEEPSVDSGFHLSYPQTSKLQVCRIMDHSGTSHENYDVITL